MYRPLQALKKIKAISQIIRASKLTLRQKRDMQGMLFVPGFADRVAELLEDGSSDNDARVAMGLAPLTTGEFKEIDWENFDWEGAKDFWIELIKVIAEIVMAFI